MPVGLDGTEGSVRSQYTKLGALICRGMGRSLAASSGEPVYPSLQNMGSVRIDDYLGPGVIIQYEALRVLPFGGRFYTIRSSGESAPLPSSRQLACPSSSILTLAIPAMYPLSPLCPSSAPPQARC